MYVCMYVYINIKIAIRVHKHKNLISTTRTILVRGFNNKLFFFQNDDEN